MKELDLHSIRHKDVPQLVERFIHENSDDLPLCIITGNSQKMHEIVTKSAEEMGYHILDTGKFTEMVIY